MMEATDDRATAGQGRHPLPVLSGWCFVICAAVAIGYGLWALYGSGGSVARLDVTEGTASAGRAAPSGSATPAAPACGPVSLGPEMNPLRAVLRAGYAPVGSRRLHYQIAMTDEAGRTLWERLGALGNKDDDASIVWTTTSLLDFDVRTPGAYALRVEFPAGSMDDLRAATIEVRRNVARVDPRITWGCGLAALGCLIVNLVASRREPFPYRLARAARRDAA